MDKEWKKERAGKRPKAQMGRPRRERTSGERGSADAPRWGKENSYAGGRNSVAEALKSGLVKRLFVKEGKRDDRLAAIIEEAKGQGISAEERDLHALDRMVPDLVHQGIVAEIKPYVYHDLDTVLAAWKGKDPFVILLDGLEDVRNLGAIIRTAECAGAAAVLLPEHRSCQVTYAAMKTAAGAAAYLPVCRIGNIRQTLEHLKEEGFWVVGTDMDGESIYNEANLKGPLCIVMGAEGKGMARLTRELCDFCVRIPMNGHVSSLNVSVAAALLLYEAEKQRRVK